MARHRTDRINEEVKRELSDILRTLRDPRIPELLSVTSVEVTPDLKFCKAYISLFGREDVKTIMKALNNSAGYVRRELGARVKLRNVPQISFVFDDSIEHGSKLLSLINSLDIPEEEESGEETDESNA
ncbi:MAG: 30S ribosome-binding factor RbfA [Clostridia bacterium]|nr:30S ribosome-binding factor RbfA [Clostridia bacterium]